MVKKPFDLSTISPSYWKGKTFADESTLHQIAPYIGKMKPSMARVLINACSKPEEVIFDPFVGSGVIALESLIAGRGIISCDVNSYAVTLTKAKIFAPPSLNQALALAEYYLEIAEDEYHNVNLDEAPEWVKKFFHPETLRETIAFANVLKSHKQDFLLGCLLGILHHQRPGFLSYPASHAIPYLRFKKFPKEKYPEMYQYRDVQSRILKKIKRTYKCFPYIDQNLPKKCFFENATKISLENESIDAVVTSPPYMNTLDYVRDNRLRLWFLNGHSNNDGESPKNLIEFKELMYNCINNIRGALRSGGLCAIVTGEIDNESCNSTNTAEAILQVADRLKEFNCEGIVDDSIPMIRRVRKSGDRVKREWIVVLRKV